MDHFVSLFLSTKTYLLKLLTDKLFYIGGVVLGAIFWLTGLSVETLYSLLIIIILDIITRCWAEHKNGRKIISKKMSAGFIGKIVTYMILFTFANHAFMFSEIFSYVVLGGFVLVEGWSIVENLEEAGNKNITKYLKNKLKQEKERFTEK